MIYKWIVSHFTTSGVRLSGKEKKKKKKKRVKDWKVYFFSFGLKQKKKSEKNK